MEVADNLPGLVPVRDSKNPDGPAILFPAGSWATFIAALKA
ncbi:regulatory protein [Streptomyces iranensis]|uniref:Regulatory protein n=1 Tax=Streptomyces iranensis TaxID=576784 RepID=A0A060ZQQ6_9ACTN|nr:regulatory protein [Streptomyces iranensis]